MATAMDRLLIEAKGRLAGAFRIQNSKIVDRKGVLFLNSLFGDLEVMYKEIEKSGNVQILFETMFGVLGDWRGVLEELCRMMKPYEVDSQISRAIQVVEESFGQDGSGQNTKGLSWESFIGVVRGLEDRVKETYLDFLNKIITFKSKLDNKEEKKNIVNRLEGNVIINLTDRKISQELLDQYANGGKFVTDLEAKSQDLFMRQQYCNVLNRMYSYLVVNTKDNAGLGRLDPNKKDRKLFNPETIEYDIKNFLPNPRLDVEDVNFLKNVILEVEDNKKSLGLKKESKLVRPPDDMILVEADKNQGICLLYKEDLLKIYQRANEKHGFVNVDITAEELIRDHMERRDRLAALIPPEVLASLNLEELRSLYSPVGVTAVLRPMLKVHKFKNPSYKDIGKMSARFVKASNGAPLNVIAGILSKVTKPMIDSLNDLISSMYGFKPARLDCQEVFEVLNREEIKNLGERCVGFEADASDMYLELRIDIVKKDVMEVLEFFGKSPEFVKFYMESLVTLMNNNYFEEPLGIFTSGCEGSRGFSIGCLYAADGSELVMVWRELRLLKLLKDLDLMRLVRHMSRYKDDFLLILVWDEVLTIEVLKLVSQAFPESLVLKFKSSPIRVDFVDQSLYFMADGDTKVKLLRKPEASYDIPRKTSNVQKCIKLGTIHSYVRRSMERNSLIKDMYWNEGLYKMILKARGYSYKEYKDIRRIVMKRKDEEKVRKGSKREKESRKGFFAGCVEYDGETKVHEKLIRSIKNCGIPKKYSKPISVPGRNIWKKEFTKRKFLVEMKKFKDSRI